MHFVKAKHSKHKNSKKYIQSLWLENVKKFSKGILVSNQILKECVF